VISIGPDAALQFCETIATWVAALLPHVICVVPHGATGGADVVLIGWGWPPPLPLLCVVWSDVVVGNGPPLPLVVVRSVAVGFVVVVGVVIGVVVSTVVVVLVGVVSVPTVVVLSVLVPGSVAGVVAVDVPSAAPAPPVASPAARPVDNAASNTAMKTWVRFTKSSLLR
jgi:hypothetical protein